LLQGHKGVEVTNKKNYLKIESKRKKGKILKKKISKKRSQDMHRKPAEG